MDLGEIGDEVELRGVDEGKTVVEMYCMKEKSNFCKNK